ncbi:uncharacterized protein LOC129870640 [Solanum dulcamara]|uniref:uncharacterized protein LOC129870640 n=1 Tax=Solanum dulcamara TaxID=45834 RepID=UPI0024859E77|nr:uncharacterized protein LOC129870640 [Solanum dulcamara]
MLQVTHGEYPTLISQIFKRQVREIINRRTIEDLHISSYLIMPPKYTASQMNVDNAEMPQSEARPSRARGQPARYAEAPQVPATPPAPTSERQVPEIINRRTIEDLHTSSYLVQIFILGIRQLRISTQLCWKCSTVLEPRFWC